MYDIFSSGGKVPIRKVPRARTIAMDSVRQKDIKLQIRQGRTSLFGIVRRLPTYKGVSFQFVISARICDPRGLI